MELQDTIASHLPIDSLTNTTLSIITEMPKKANFVKQILTSYSARWNKTAKNNYNPYESMLSNHWVLQDCRYYRHTHPARARPIVSLESAENAPFSCGVGNRRRGGGAWKRNM